jgi:hypothetical protein
MTLEEVLKQLTELLEPLIEDSKKSSRRMILNMTESSEDYRPQAEMMARVFSPKLFPMEFRTSSQTQSCYS